MSSAEVIHVLVLICEAGMCFLLFEAFLRHRTKANKWMIGTTGLLLTVCFATIQERNDDPAVTGLMMMMAALVVSWLVYQGRWYKRVLAVFSAVAVMAVSIFVSTRIVMGVFYLSQVQATTMSSYHLLITIVSMGVGLVFCNALRIKCTLRASSRDVVFWWWLVVLLVIAVMLCLLLFWMSSQIKPLSFNALAVAGAVGVFFSLFTTMALYERLGGQRIEARRMAQREQALRNQMKYLDEMIAKQKMVRRFKHDLNNQLLVFNEYLSRNDVEGAQKYLDSLTKTFVKMMPLIDTGNIALDTILTAKKTLADSKRIVFRMKVQVPMALKVEPMDVATILGNALDNAIEACEGLEEGARWIEVSLVQQEAALLCKITNSALPQRSDEWVTTKDDGENHGIGLESIRSTLEKYDTLPLIEQSDGVFSLSFVIYC